MSRANLSGVWRSPAACRPWRSPGSSASPAAAIPPSRCVLPPWGEGRGARGEKIRRRSHDEVVRALFHARAELAQLGRHRGDPVGFLHAPAADVAQPAWAGGEEREHRAGHGRVRDQVQVEVERRERRAAGGLDPGIAEADLRAHDRRRPSAVEAGSAISPRIRRRKSGSRRPSSTPPAPCTMHLGTPVVPLE